MTSLQIPEALREALEIAAETSGRSKEQVVVEILSAHFADESLPASVFTDPQLTRIKESIAQISRGEVVSEENSDAFFEDWYKEIEAR